MKSKLFTPKLRSPQATACEAVESAEIFMNPPTHAEIPRFSGNTDSGPSHTLRLGGSGKPSTKEVSRRPFLSTAQEKMDY